MPDDLGAAFDERPGAREQWDEFAPSAKRAYLFWIVSAKREATRAKRVAETAEAVATGKRFEER